MTTCQHGYPQGNCPQCLTIRYSVEASIHRLTTQQLEQAKHAIEQRVAEFEEIDDV